MELLAGIENGQWVPGEAIPPERKIAEECGVSLGTVNRALANWSTRAISAYAGQGHLCGRHHHPLESVRYTRLRREFSDPDPRFKIKVLSLEVVPGFQPVTRLLKLRGACKCGRCGGVSLAMRAPHVLPVLPASQFVQGPGQSDHPPHGEDNPYESIRKKIRPADHLQPGDVQRVAADQQVAEVLEIEIGAPVLKIEMLSFTYKEKPYEYQVSYCNTEDFKMFREM